MAKNTAILRTKLPKPPSSVTSPLGRRKPPHPTLTSWIRRRKQPHRTLKSRIRRRRIQPQPTLTAPSLHLPFDLVAEILCRLSVKQLTQLRCVCKSWNFLISEDSMFAKKHLRLSTSCQGRHHLFLKSTKFHHLQCPISTLFTSKDAATSRYSVKEGKSIGGYFSTCDGMLCCKIDNSSAFLFNPSVRKFIILPSLESPDQSYVQMIYTLVYDRFINNYKVIALNSFSDKRKVNVHILGTDYWRRIQDFPSTNQSLWGTEEGIFVSDSVNWLLSKFIVSLDLEKESYQMFSLPDSNVKLIHPIAVTLGTLRGCLSLLFSGKCLADVWIMKEFGNEKSWTKFLTVPYIKAWGRCRLSKILYISEDDQVLMEIFGTMLGSFSPKYTVVVYDSINKTFQFPEFQNKIHDDDMVPEVYVESLISPF